MSYQVVKNGKTYTASEWCRKLNNERHKVPYKATYGILKKRCRQKDIPLDMSFNEFLKFTKIDTCHYCHKSIKWIKHGKVTAYNLDRKNNNKGYSFDNCVVSCWNCNNSRGNRFSYEDWHSMTKYLRDRAEIYVDRLFEIYNGE